MGIERHARGVLQELMSRRASRRDILKSAAALSASGVALPSLLAACKSTTSSPSSVAGTPSQKMVVASGADAVTLDPGVSFDGQSNNLWRQQYQSLMRYPGTSLEMEPLLAESVNVSEDGQIYTFKIRPNVKFNDGTPLDADAVRISIERQINLKQGVSYALEPISSIDITDPMELTVKLKQFSDGFLSAFAGSFSVMMISPKALKDHEVDGDLAQGWLRDHMVGTGPYVLQSYTQGQSAHFTYNSDYWEGWKGAHVADAVVQYVHEPTSERLMLERGEVDIALFLPDDMIEEMDGAKDIAVTDIKESLLAYYLVLPSSKGPTKDLKVRQALSHGLDYDTWCKENMRGKAVPMHGPIPSSMIGYNPKTPQYKYDPDKARQLLAEAGYPNGGFSLKYVYETGYAWKRPLGEFFQANMKDLGIDVSIQEVSAASYDALLTNPETAEHVFALVWYPTLATPYDYLFACFATPAQGTAGYNRGYYSNPSYDKLLEQAVAEPDEAKRNDLYGQAQVILVEDAPALFVYEKNYRLPMRSNVKGFVYNGVLWETVYFYWLSKA